MTSPSVPVSWGEVLDKLTILEIKLDRLDDPAARGNVAHEHALLHAIAVPVMEEVAGLLDQLRAINAALWDIEDAIRREEALGLFGAEFVALARSVYRTNDERAALKRAINMKLASEIVEEKSYWVPQTEGAPTLG
jgi:Family of unknown function (DUF6165)